MKGVRAGKGRYLIAVRGTRKNSIFAFKTPSARKSFVKFMRKETGKNFDYATATIPLKKR